MLARFSALKRSDRLRAIGWFVLASGLVCAAAFYWIKTRTADPALDDVTALGYTRSLQHEMGVLMGQSGVILTEWQAGLTSPIGQALMIALCATLVAGYFFRVAVDAESNVYTGEVDTAGRIQKFLAFGSPTCSGTGSPDIGKYKEF